MLSWVVCAYDRTKVGVGGGVFERTYRLCDRRSASTVLDVTLLHIILE